MAKGDVYVLRSDNGWRVETEGSANALYPPDAG